MHLILVFPRSPRLSCPPSPGQPCPPDVPPYSHVVDADSSSAPLLCPGFMSAYWTSLLRSLRINLFSFTQPLPFLEFSAAINDTE